MSVDNASYDWRSIIHTCVENMKSVNELITSKTDGNFGLKELDDYTSHIRQLVKELETVESAYTTRKAELEQARTDWAEGKSSRATELANLDNDVSSKKNARCEAEAIYEREKFARGSELNALTDKIIQGKKSLETLNSSHEIRMVKTHTELNNATQELETIRQAITNEKAMLLSVKQERGDYLKILETKLTEARGKTPQGDGALKKTIYGLRQENAQLQTKSYGEGKALQSLQKNLSEFQSTIASLQVNLDTLRPEIKQNLANLMVAQRSRDENWSSDEFNELRTINEGLTGSLISPQQQNTRNSQSFTRFREQESQRSEGLGRLELMKEGLTDNLANHRKQTNRDNEALSRLQKTNMTYANSKKQTSLLGARSDLLPRVSESRMRTDPQEPLSSSATIERRDSLIRISDQGNDESDLVARREDDVVCNMSQKPTKRRQLTYPSRSVRTISTSEKEDDSSVTQSRKAIPARTETTVRESSLGKFVSPHRITDTLAETTPNTRIRKRTASMSPTSEEEARVKSSRATYKSEAGRTTDHKQGTDKGTSVPKAGGVLLRWAIAHVRREGFTDDALPIEIWNWAHERMVELDERRTNWTRATGTDGGPVCAQAYSKKHPTRWTNKRRDLPCKACSRKENPCLIVQDGRMDILGFEAAT